MSDTPAHTPRTDVGPAVTPEGLIADTTGLTFEALVEYGQRGELTPELAGQLGEAIDATRTENDTELRKLLGGIIASGEVELGAAEATVESDVMASLRASFAGPIAAAYQEILADPAEMARLEGQPDEVIEAHILDRAFSRVIETNAEANGVIVTVETVPAVEEPEPRVAPSSVEPAVEPTGPSPALRRRRSGFVTAADVRAKRALEAADHGHGREGHDHSEHDHAHPPHAAAERSPAPAREVEIETTIESIDLPSPTPEDLAEIISGFGPQEIQQFSMLPLDKQEALLAKEWKKRNFPGIASFDTRAEAFEKVKKSARRNPRFNQADSLVIPEGSEEALFERWVTTHTDQLVELGYIDDAGEPLNTTALYESFLADAFENMSPGPDGYIPTRRELERLRKQMKEAGSSIESASFNRATAYWTAKYAAAVNRMYPNGIEYDEAQANEAFRKITGEQTGNGDDNAGRILFVQKRINPETGEVEYYTFDPDGQKKLTREEIKIRNERVKDINEQSDTVAEIGAWSAYEVTKMQEDMQEEGWNAMINVWADDFHLTDSQIIGLYTALKFINKGNILTNKYKTPKKYVRSDGTTYWKLGPVDRVGYVVEASEKFPKHGYQWSTHDVLYQKREVEACIQTMKKFMFARDVTEPKLETVQLNTHGHMVTYEVMNYNKVSADVKKNDDGSVDYEAEETRAALYLEYAEAMFFLMHMKSMIESSKLGPAMGEPGEDKMEAMQAQQRAEQLASQSTMGYPPQIPGSDQANKYWQQIDRLLIQMDLMMPGIITREPAEPFPEQVFEAVDGQRWTYGRVEVGEATDRAAEVGRVFDAEAQPTSSRLRRGQRRRQGVNGPRIRR